MGCWENMKWVEQNWGKNQNGIPTFFSLVNHSNQEKNSNSPIFFQGLIQLPLKLMERFDFLKIWIDPYGTDWAKKILKYTINFIHMNSSMSLTVYKYYYIGERIFTLRSLAVQLSHLPPSFRGVAQSQTTEANGVPEWYTPVENQGLSNCECTQKLSSVDGSWRHSSAKLGPYWSLQTVSGCSSDEKWMILLYSVKEEKTFLRKEVRLVSRKCWFLTEWGKWKWRKMIMIGLAALSLWNKLLVIYVCTGCNDTNNFLLNILWDANKGEGEVVSKA